MIHAFSTVDEFGCFAFGASAATILGGRTKAGICVRIAQRILALFAAIWHNDQTDAPTLRSLTAYDH